MGRRLRVTPADLRLLGLMLGVGLGVAAVFMVLLFGGFFALFAVSDLCRNDVVAETTSPSGASRLVVFRRGCGATTPWGTHASVLGPHDRIDESDEVGNALRLSPPPWDPDFPRAAHGGPELGAVWRSDTLVELRHRRGARVSHIATRIQGVQVVHVESP